METETTTEEKDKKKYGAVTRIQRLGKVANDAEYASKNRVWIKLFLDYLPNFTALDAQFDAAYAQAWYDLTELFTKLPTDETVMDGVAVETEELLDSYKPVIKLADELEFFVGKAFPDDVRKVDEFGFKLLRRVSNQASLKFSHYARTMQVIAKEYETQLLAAGLPVAWFGSFEAAVLYTSKKELDQEVEKRHRIRTTTERVRLYNQLHATWQRVYKASRVIYADNDTMQKLWQW